MNRKQRRAARKVNRSASQIGGDPQLVGEFAAAVEHLKAGRLSDAAAAHQRVLQVDPRHAPSLHHLGLIEHKSGNGKRAVELIRQCLSERPGYPDAHLNLSVILGELGRIDEAIDAVEKAIALRPGHAGAHFHLGNFFRKNARYADAERAYAKAVELEPTLAAAHTNLASVLAAQERLEDALAACHGALTLSPTLAEAHGILGQILQRQGRNTEAIAAYECALALKPELGTLHTELGNVLRLQHRFEEAIAAHQRTMSLKPDCPEAYCNLALTLQDLGRYAEAYEAYQNAIRLKPDYAEAYSNLGVVLRILGKSEDAIAAIRQAIALKPRFAVAHYNLASTLKELGRLQDADRAFRQALACNFHLTPAWFEFCDLRRHACDWRGLEKEEAASLSDARANGTRVAPFAILAMQTTPADHHEHARAWACGMAVPGSKVVSQYGVSSPQEKRRIRVGYLSSDFHSHATARLIAELIERHDRKRFEIFAYCYSPDDGSDMRRRIRAAFDRFVEIRLLPHALAARRIHADGIDVLVDLKGYTRGARTEILAYRPAPIQVNFLGYPGTMGADFIDYIVADAFVVPMHQQAYFDEKIVHLPATYQPNDTRRRLADRIPSRPECGLPEEGFVFCAFNNTFKITEKLFAIWMRLLDRVEGSVLWLLEANELCKGNLQREAATRGVDPKRLVFAPRLPSEDHLARHRLADLFLDTLPYNAHTTASDALWTGLPVLTCAGEAFAGRVAGSLLYAIGLPELVTQSLDEYEALALRLAQDPAMLGTLREKLAHNRFSTPLFDIERYARNIETAYAHMVQLRTSGRQPEAFAVSELPEKSDAPAMLAKSDTPSTRIAYTSCPLCESGDIHYHIEADTTRHALYKPALPKTMKWRICGSCAHVFTEGYWATEMCDLIFSDGQACQRVGCDLEGQRKVSARIVERIARHVPGGDWLDVGFGNASLLFTAEEWGYRPVGVDLRKDNVEALRKLSIEAHCVQIEEIDDAARFSVVSMADVLEHMPFPKKGLYAAHRLLRPGGVLFVSMPNMASIVWRALDAAGTNPYWGEIEHYHNFTRQRLNALLEECGFSPLDYNISERYRSCMEVVAAKGRHRGS
jgi:predicted O-linked N-acetylglucosamine transferase (SPINDLY family)/SAM-dependent methyltransferase